MDHLEISRRSLLGGAAICLTAIQQSTLGGEESPTPKVVDPQTYLAKFRELAAAKWPKNRALRIVCHGHSVPAGYFVTPVVRTFDSYPHLLHVGLAERFPTAVINVVVTAIGGEASVTGAARFEKDVLSLQPDLITIDYALNDRRLGLQAAHKAWSSMILAAKKAGVPVLLLTPTPDTKAKLNEETDPLNQHAAQIRALAAEHAVGLVDSLAAFQAAVAAGKELTDFMSQVNHPNRAGHELVAQKLMEYFPK
ncbi:MAG: SGNH/GDSL hydrolase family protein [Zavarzinella sp.]